MHKHKNSETDSLSGQTTDSSGVSDTSSESEKAVSDQEMKDESTKPNELDSYSADLQSEYQKI